jgi:Transposase, Mutator family
MTETLVGVNPPSLKDPTDPPSPEELAAAKELVRQARAQGVALTGPGGLLKALTKTVIETALEEEMAEHLGYDKHDPLGRNRGNSRNGKRAKTVLTDSGEVAVQVPRDRDGSFEPVIVAKRQRRLCSIDEIVLSLYARGLTTGDIAAHFAEISDTRVWKGHHLPDHRPGGGGDASLNQPAAGAGLCRGGCGRDQRQGPRRLGRQPARLCRDRGRPGGPKRHLGHVVRRRRRGVGKVLDGSADRAAQPRRG